MVLTYKYLIAKIDYLSQWYEEGKVQFTELLEEMEDYFLFENDTVIDSKMNYFKRVIELEGMVEYLKSSSVLYSDVNGLWVNHNSTEYHNIVNVKNSLRHLRNHLAVVPHEENTTLNDNTQNDSSESDSQNDTNQNESDNQYYEINSFTGNGKYYIDVELSSCTCPAFSNNPNKGCKHIVYLKNQKDLKSFPIKKMNFLDEGIVEY